MWTYHAVAAVIRGHSLLASLEGVDPNRTGVTGISWGGYLTCIVAGVDDRFKVAVPVYGCGFLHENSVWLPRFAEMKPEQARPLGAAVRSLAVSARRAVPDSLHERHQRLRLSAGQLSEELPAGAGPPSIVRIEVRMPHGHPQGWAPKEIGLYVDSILKGGDPLPRLGPMKTADGKAAASFTAKVPVVRGQLHFTSDTGPWQNRRWESADANSSAKPSRPPCRPKRPLVYYLSVTDQRGAMVSTGHAVLP